MYKNSQLVKVGFLSVMCLSDAANAQDLNYSIFGNVHVSLDDQKSVGNRDLNSNTTTFGIKGGQKLNDDVKVIFKLEWQLDATNREATPAFVYRDQWVGFKGDFGKFIVGTSSSNYKQTSSKVDPLWRTQLEGRSTLMAISSQRLSGGAGNDRGRLTNLVSYTSPKFYNVNFVANTTFSGVDSESSGIGIRHTTKNSLIFIDYFNDGDVGNTNIFGATDYVAGTKRSAVKVGGYYVLGGLTLSGQLESSEDIDGSDYKMLGASYKINDSGTVKFTLGEASGVQKSSSFAFLYDYTLGENTNVYAGYGSKDDDTNANADDDIVTIGTRYIF